jgi:DNA-binding IclR family transcriptional regulator
MKSAEQDARRRKPRTAQVVDIAERSGVQSVAIAATILKTLAAEGGVAPLKRLSSATGMPRAKVHRYLASLRGSGLIAQDAESGEYRIGPAAITVGLVGLGRTGPVRQLLDALPRLRDRINETVTAAIWSENGPTLITMEECDRAVTMNVRIGTVLPLSASAIGRVFLAELPSSMTQRLLSAEHKAGRAFASAPPTDKQLAKLLSDIRTHGISVGYGAMLPGVDAMAAPVFDYRGKLAAVICAVGLFEGIASSADQHVRRSLTDAARELSKQLGFVDAR